MNALLKGLVEEPAGGDPGDHGASGDSPLSDPPKVQIQRLRYEHRAMAKLISANPTISQGQLAEIFGYSESWISTIICSDVFQSILSEEMEKSPFGAEWRATSKLQVEGILQRSLEILRHKLDKAPDQVPDQLALQTARMAAGALDMGAQKRVSVSETHIHLENLAGNLVGLLHREKGRVLEHNSEPASLPAGGHGAEVI